jgi:hypothetical protein
LWLAFGVLTGLALLSKYIAVLPAGAVAAALLTSRRGRAMLRTAGPWLALVVAVAIFSPVIYWNAKHGWASFKFQLHHGLDAQQPDLGSDDESVAAATPAGPTAGVRFASLGIYLAGQLGFYTPVFFIFGVVVVAIRWGEYGRLGLADRILIWSATVPLLFFGLAAFKSASPGEGNWPAFGYFPMSLLMMAHVARLWKPFDVKWLKIGAGIALAITLVLHSPDGLYKGMQKVGLGARFPRKLNEFYGWRELGRSVYNQVTPAVGGPVLIVAGRHQDAAELSFYMPGQPEVWVINGVGKDGKPVSRPTAYDYFPDRPDVRQLPAVVFFWGHADAFCDTYQFVTAGLQWKFSIFLHGLERERKYELLRNTYGPGQNPATTRQATP